MACQKLYQAKFNQNEEKLTTKQRQTEQKRPGTDRKLVSYQIKADCVQHS